MNYDDILNRLSKSKFRNSFHLNNNMKKYVLDQGFTIIKKHVEEIITKRLGPANIPNDGKQTPMRQVHPVFIAQHACACCCRKCLSKWHHISQNRELTTTEIQYIVNLIMLWIDKECC